MKNYTKTHAENNRHPKELMKPKFRKA